MRITSLKTSFINIAKLHTYLDGLAASFSFDRKPTSVTVCVCVSFVSFGVIFQSFHDSRSGRS